jgi:hypothetical protein
MRHLIGVALAIVMAAAVFFAASWGYLKLLSSPARGSVLPAGGGSLIHDHAVLEGFGALLAVGLLAGLLIAVPRVSPLAAGLPGLALLGWTGLYLFSVRRAVRYIPLKSHSYGAGFEALLFGGLLAVAGLAMVIPLFVPSRWMRRAVVAAAPAPYEAPAPDYPDLRAPDYPDLQATQTIGGGMPADWAETRPQPRPEPGPAQAPWGPAEPIGREGQDTTVDFS